MNTILKKMTYFHVFAFIISLIFSFFITSDKGLHKTVITYSFISLLLAMVNNKIVEATFGKGE
jgi:uncharacterized MnhB-related membrane protein